MYRRRIKKPPTPAFPDSLEEMGYSINDEGAVIDASGNQYVFDLKAKDRNFQEAHSRALGDAVLRVMNKRLEDEYGFIRVKVPLGLDENDTTSPQADIFISADAKTCKRLLVLIPGTMEPLGSWSRRLLCNTDVKLGSMHQVVELARENGFGVVVLNPNSHWFVNGRPTVLVPTTKEYHLIPNLGSPEEHVNYVFENIIKSATSNEIFFIAHKYGTHALIQALHDQFDTFKDRVSAIAVVEGTHTIDSFPFPIFRKWWSLNAVGYVQSEPEEKGKVERQDFAGCNCVNAGPQEFDCTLVNEMPNIFKFFNARKGRDNIFDHYKDKLQPLNEDDPSTSMVTIEDVSIDKNENADEFVSY